MRERWERRGGGEVREGERGRGKKGEGVVTGEGQRMTVVEPLGVGRTYSELQVLKTDQSDIPMMS